MQLLQLWEKNGYFDEVTIQQLQSPALGLAQYQVNATRARDTQRAVWRTESHALHSNYTIVTKTQTTQHSQNLCAPWCRGGDTV